MHVSDRSLPALLRRWHDAAEHVMLEPIFDDRSIDLPVGRGQSVDTALPIRFSFYDSTLRHCPPHFHLPHFHPSKHKLPSHLDTLTISGELRGNVIVDMEPQSKRQKRSGDEKEAAEIIAFGGPMYDEATARKMLKEAVLVPAEFRGSGEGVIGFDPDDAALDNIYAVKTDVFDGKITPMIHFARKGDGKMCRYLISRGASTTKTSELEYPLYAMYAAANHGYLDICELLYANGAQDDVRRDDGDGWTPFHVAAVTGQVEVMQWLTLHGALCADGSSEEIEKDRIYLDDSWRDGNMSVISRSCVRLVEWAKEVTQSHSALVNFLLGTLPPAPGKDQSCILQYFSGHPGVRKHIGDFVGLEITKGKQLRILRQVVDVLPSYIASNI